MFQLQCNNPMTKESKLSSAMRIIPEWKEYDDEIRLVVDRFWKERDNTTEEESQTADMTGKERIQNPPKC